MPVVSSYDPITGANLADGDDFLVIDVSDSSMAATGTTKRVTKAEMPFVPSVSGVVEWVPGGAFGGGDLYIVSTSALDLFAYDHWDGVSGPFGSGFSATSGYTNGGSVYFQAADKTYLQIQANDSQTDAVLNVTQNDLTPIIQATGDAKIGFYAAAPVAQQTGVAVNAAGIHAALVSLGLITA